MYMMLHSSVCVTLFPEQPSNFENLLFAFSFVYRVTTTKTENKIKEIWS